MDIEVAFLFLWFSRFALWRLVLYILINNSLSKTIITFRLMLFPIQSPCCLLMVKLLNILVILVSV